MSNDLWRSACTRSRPGLLRPAPPTRSLRSNTPSTPCPTLAPALICAAYFWRLMRQPRTTIGRCGQCKRRTCDGKCRRRRDRRAGPNPGGCRSRAGLCEAPEIGLPGQPHLRCLSSELQATILRNCFPPSQSEDFCLRTGRSQTECRCRSARRTRSRRPISSLCRL